MLDEAAQWEPSALDGRDDEIRERMSGNICRCGAYPNIVAAIEDVVVMEPFRYEPRGRRRTTRVAAIAAARRSSAAARTSST